MSERELKKKKHFKLTCSSVKHLQSLKLSLVIRLHSHPHYVTDYVTHCCCFDTLTLTQHLTVTDPTAVLTPPLHVSVDQVSYRSGSTLLHYRFCSCCCVSTASALFHFRHWQGMTRVKGSYGLVTEDVFTLGRPFFCLPCFMFFFGGGTCYCVLTFYFWY